MRNKRHLENLCAFMLVILHLVSGSSKALAADDKASQPLIGINVDYDEDKADSKKISSYKVYSSYVKAVSKAGGIPVILPPMDDEKLKQIYSRLDGLVLVGGADYPASYYNEKNHETADEMISERADFDLRLARIALADKSKPVLGICAGCQILNISGGGSLIQDIPSHIKDSKVLHRRPEGHPKTSRFMHQVEINASSRLGSFYQNKKLFVPTSHHQCVGKVAEQFKVVAHTQDGVIEAIESKDNRFLFGVQWHPERDYDNNQTLWETFIKQCDRYSRNSKEQVSQSQP